MVVKHSCGMPLNPSPNTNYGNLQAYKFYIRATAHRLFGDIHYNIKQITKHQENVQKLLEILAFEGSLTTWEMAKSKFSRDSNPIRSKEKEYRRLLIGREDRGKRSPGIIDVGLVTKIKDYNRGPSSEYRLTPHGILYCLDVLNFTNKQIDVMASKYAYVLPKVFGKWENLKQNIGEDIYKIRLLAKGLTLDNTEIIKTTNIPFYELMSFITTKYRENFEYASEEQLSDQISFWFFTNILYSPESENTFRKIPSGIRKLRSIFKMDRELAEWYKMFFLEAKQFYKERHRILRESVIFR